MKRLAKTKEAERRAAEEEEDRWYVKEKEAQKCKELKQHQVEEAR